ncbi:MAG: response regulator containing a CheY-like receiver domain and an HD-GYP domain [bacterium]|nr:MAG: response regulator containing a CheY-like receiver domain and an HD-GYP domain [bacterium]KAF0149665.1 MAG: response regulator containing a CheY-like receiver domain and an HD-GYP domain [bacterium]KAF0169331.1 MAG: response regulator containing a CheY-like receiver domain and an HD-GYP domain [bacterium]TXT21395.1 MAG: response regulator containing a CheY-like receiver domain and an HD-GYP domain [bacterium]
MLRGISATHANTDMTDLHRTLLQRLLLAWLLVSLVAGGAVYYLERARFNDAIVGLVAEHATRLDVAQLVRDGAADAAYQSLLSQTREFIANNYVLIDIRDREGRQIAGLVHPQRRSLEQAARPELTALPHDRGSHMRILNVKGERLIHVGVPLPARDGGQAGYFEGLFLLDEATRAAFQTQIRRPLVAVLLAVLGTTLVLYPVILALNRSVLRASREILKGNLEMASVLGAAIAKRDSDTGDHNYRVTLYALRLGEAAGLDDTGLRGLILGAFLHDVGKIGIPDPVLLKPGRLDAAEFEIMRRHVGLGEEIIAKSDWLRPARDVVAGHHEKFDGSGYPLGLKGEAIPLNARIFAIVDVFDALTSRRPYKDPLSLEASLEIIRSGGGTHFDPSLVERFLELAAELHADIGGRAPDALSVMLRRQALRLFLGAED